MAGGKIGGYQNECNDACIKHGGAAVQEMGWALRKSLRWVVRAVMGVALVTLTAGVWVCLWVPPSF
jgi:hypothetical protein